MTSLRQRLLRLNAWIVQKPTLALVRNTRLARHLFTLSAVLSARTPRGFTQERITLADRPAFACVWELAVIAHERDAWVRTMLTDTPDAQAWHRDLLPAGLH